MSYSISFNRFFLVYTLFGFVLFGQPALILLMNVVDIFSLQGFTAAASFYFLQSLLMYLLLFALSLLGGTVLKYAAAFLFAVNCVALYFFVSIQIVLDEAVIASIFNAGWAEMIGVVPASYVVIILILGVILGAALRNIEIELPSPMLRVRDFGIFTAIFLMFATLTSPIHLTLDAIAQRSGARTLPWYYIMNLVRHYQVVGFAEAEVDPLPDATVIKQPNSAQKTVVVFVIGESARRLHMGHYGYARDTTPFTQMHDVIVIDGGKACNTNTLSVVACMLSPDGNKAPRFPTLESLPSYLNRHGVDVHYRDNNGGAPPIKLRSNKTTDRIVED